MPRNNVNPLIVIGGVVITVLIIIALLNFRTSAAQKDKFTSGFKDFDLSFDTTDPRIADPKHGTATKAQLSMENRLYSNIRAASSYALPATMTTDAYNVIAREAEPTPCMLQRAATARETSLPEGQYTPWDEIEDGFMKRTKKQPLALQAA